MGHRLGIQVCKKGFSRITAVANYYGLGNNFRAEVLALLHGLRRCVELGFLNVIAESDSQSLVKMLVTNDPWPWQFDSELYEISGILSASGYSLTHIFREANSVADGL